MTFPEITLPEGEYNLQAIFSDEVGNQTSNNISFRVGASSEKTLYALSGSNLFKRNWDSSSQTFSSPEEISSSSLLNFFGNPNIGNNSLLNTETMAKQGNFLYHEIYQGGIQLGRTNLSTGTTEALANSSGGVYPRSMVLCNDNIYFVGKIGSATGLYRIDDFGSFVDFTLLESNARLTACIKNRLYYTVGSSSTTLKVRDVVGGGAAQTVMHVTHSNNNDDIGLSKMIVKGNELYVLAGGGHLAKVITGESGEVISSSTLISNNDLNSVNIFCSISFDVDSNGDIYFMGIDLVDNLTPKLYKRLSSSGSISYLASYIAGDFNLNNGVNSPDMIVHNSKVFMSQGADNSPDRGAYLWDIGTSSLTKLYMSTFNSLFQRNTWKARILDEENILYFGSNVGLFGGSNLLLFNTEDNSVFNVGQIYSFLID